MIGKITIDIVSKCNGIIPQEAIAQFQSILSSVLGQYDITEKEYAIVTYDERLNKGYQMFFVSKKIEGLSDRSLSYYKTTIDSFCSSSLKSLDTITTDDVRYYIATKQMRDNIAPTTANNIRRVLCSFFGWLTQEGYIAKNPMLSFKQIKSKKKIKHAFSDIEIEKIKEECLKIEHPLKRKRAIALVETLLSTGCRIGEITSIKISDIDFNNKSIIVLGKGNKERKVYLNDKANLRIKDYLKERNGRGDDYLFVSNDSPFERVKISGIEIAIRKLGKKAGIKECYPHKFRRTAATIALRRGMNIIDIQRMLGHENLDTTKIYLDLDDSNLEMQHRRFM